jgi:hypothetical protein
MPGEIANNCFPKETKIPQDLDDKIKIIKYVLSGETKTGPIVFGDTRIEQRILKLDTEAWKQYADCGRETPALADVNEKNDYRGGSYGELKEEGYGWPDHEVHHMPADSASELPREDGPAIVMDYEDHRQTASYGFSKEAAEYRQTQRDLIAEGKFMEAQQMDIDDIHEKFDDKYDKAIAEAQEHARKLKEEGRV